MRIGVIIVELILGVVILSLLGFYMAIRPSKVISELTPKNLGLVFESVEFKTEDNVLLRGWFIPSKKPQAKTIILLHGYPADKGNILPVMSFLHSDYHLFLFDFRYFGESEGSYSTAGKKEVLDLLAAIRYLQSKNIHEVGVWGFSFGGAVAMMAAPHTSAIKAIVADSSYARLDWMAEEYYRLPLLRYPLAALTRLWGKIFLGYDLNSVSPVESLKKLKIPVLLIYSKKDEVTPARHGELLQKVSQNNPEVEVIALEEGAHGQLMSGYEKIISDFFLKALKK